MCKHNIAGADAPALLCAEGGWNPTLPQTAGKGGAPSFSAESKRLDGLVEAQVARGCAYADGAFAGCGDPLGICGGPVLQLARRDMEGDGLGFAGSEMDAIEGYESANRELNACGNLAGCAEVNLRHFVAGQLPVFLMLTMTSKPPSEALSTLRSEYSKVV